MDLHVTDHVSENWLFEGSNFWTIIALTCCYLVIFVQKPPIIHVIIHMGVLKNNSEMY